MKQTWSGPLEKIDDYRWRIPKRYNPGMRVPGIIYADENLLRTIRTDRAAEQVANVAHLPGIVKYSLAMPDIHWGYGFCIGGVAATDIQAGGVVAPGGIGYDINCLSGEAKILLDNGAYIQIKDFENKFDNTNLSCIDFTKNSKTNAEIQRFIKIKPQNKVYRMKTLFGNEIVATADHPFWTPDGMIPLKQLGVEDRVAIYPFQGVPYEDPSDKIVVDEKDVKKILLSLGKDSRGHGLEQCIGHLKRRNLLPLKYNSPQLPYLLKVMGYIFGDGSIYFTNKRGKGQTWFYGNPEDLSQIKEDVVKVGYKCSVPYSRIRKHKIKTAYSEYSFTNETFACKVWASSFAVLLVALGTPLGNKTNQKTHLPKWIFRAPLWQKRLFLSSFFGAEMSTPKTMTRHSYNFYAPVISMNKKKGYLKNGKEFFQELSLLLKEFDVQVNKISQRYEYKNKASEKTFRFRLILSGLPANLINLYSKIGFEYNQKRKTKANAAVLYLKFKESIIQEKERLAREALDLKETVGIGAKAIYDKLNPEVVNFRFIERTIYGGRTNKPRVSPKTITFDEFLEYYTRGLRNSGMLWDRITAIKQVEFDDYVYDFTVEHKDHNFIANNFVVSNCGVRLMRTNLSEKDIRPKIRDLVYALFNNIPAGVGSKGKIRASGQDERKLLIKGAKWALERGYGKPEDLEYTEERGAIEGADPGAVSSRAFERGERQPGTLGSGNHFIEVQVIDQIYDEDAAEIFNLDQGDITVMIHSGSRGFGYQICDDYAKGMIRCLDKYGIHVPDRQLACAPVNSHEGKSYLGAMCCAANYAWCNRQILMELTRRVFQKFFNLSPKDLGMDLIYDLAHNIAKIEKHIVDGKEKTLCVHRKGATRAFPPGHKDLPEKYQSVGQPVIIPGDMGRNSYLLVGQELAAETFYSTCHGSGRMMSRQAAIRSLKGRSIARELEQKGIFVRSTGRETLAEEAPEAYKNVNEVVHVVHEAGISKRICRMRPLAVIKG